MKKLLTINEIEILLKENEKLKGTSDWRKYHMENTFKSQKTGKWVFASWSVPVLLMESQIKKVKNNYYIMQGDDRYLITEAVNKLLKIY